MGHCIHANKIGSGYVYRIWSTTSDSYVTDEMTEGQVREHNLKEAIEDAIESYESGVEARFNRAHKTGTSALNDSRPTDKWGEWEDPDDIEEEETA